MFVKTTQLRTIIFLIEIFRNFMDYFQPQRKTKKIVYFELREIDDESFILLPLDLCFSKDYKIKKYI